MDLGLQGRVALVTGRVRRIGRATAEDLAREGARVAICARRAEPVTLLVNNVGMSAARSLEAVDDDAWYGGLDLTLCR